MSEQPEQAASVVNEPQAIAHAPEETTFAATETEEINNKTEDVEMTDVKDADTNAANKVNGAAELPVDGEATATIDDAPEGALDIAADDSKKGRRKSAGVPEHRQKRTLVKKKSTVNVAEQPDPEVGDYRLGRVKGYPAWPCIVCEDEMLPDNLLLKRPVGAKRPDGTYRPEFADGGKKAHERSFPVMFLFTNDFGWLTKVNLDPLDQETAEAGPPNAKAKGLADAYRQAAESQPLQYFKDLLSAHEAFVAEKQAKKAAKSKKSKAKSADLVDDDMDIDEDLDAEDSAKPSKKRKKDVDSDGETDKPAKTPKRKGSVKALASGIKLKLTTPKEPKKSESKDEKKVSTKKSKKPKEEEKQKPALTPEEIQKQKDKPVLWFRHQLQRRFLNTSSVPADEDIGVMNECITKLEENPDLEATTIRNTKIHKVLKGIIKLNFIPKDEEFSFKQRAHGLLQKWKKALSEDVDGAADEEKPVQATNGDHEARSISKSVEPKADVFTTEKSTEAIKAEEVAKPSELTKSEAEEGSEPVTASIEKLNGVTAKTLQPEPVAAPENPEPETASKPEPETVEKANHDAPIETLKAVESIEAAS